MKTNPKNQQAVKNPNKVNAVDPVVRDILTQFPSMGAGKALACALNVYSHRSRKAGSAAAMEKSIQKAVTDCATVIVTNRGGGVFVEGREHATAQVLLRAWSKPDNEFEVAKFLKLLDQGRQVYEKAVQILSEPIKEKSPPAKH
jgi:hypothetical protein